MDNQTQKKIFLRAGLITALLVAVTLLSVHKIINTADKRICATGPGTTEENIILMKKSLEKLVEVSSDEDVKGKVIFKDGVITESFISLFPKYQISAEGEEDVFGGASFQLLLDDGDAIGGFSLDSTQLSAEGFKKWLDAYSWPPVMAKPTFENARINSFVAFARASDFLRLWNENENIVRAIGIDCTMPHYTPKPSEDIDLNFPPPLR